jgi:hypothetical protein
MNRRLAIPIILISVLIALSVGGCSRSSKNPAILDLPYTFPLEICHATGSEDNPYVAMTINSPNALQGHLGHEGDLIPAPAEGCAPVVMRIEPTWTFTPVQTATPVPTNTPTFVPTNTPTWTPTPTYTPTATFTPTISPNTDFLSVEGPLSGTIRQCYNEYTATVTDSDGLVFVRVEYFLNSTIDPDDSGYFDLTDMGNNTWSGYFVIDTSVTSGDDTVYWRFWSEDTLGNTVYSPSVSNFYFMDASDCSGGT